MTDRQFRKIVRKEYLMIPWWQRNTIHGRVEVVLMWVLALLMAGLFVLWATVGWAGETTVRTLIPANYCIATCSEKTCIPIECATQETELLSRMIPARECERKMEAAMRAMDPFVDPPKDGVSVSINEIFAGDKLWKAVKRECWRQP